MKSRSQRLPINDQPDDWVDGSWTVDCMCGVNYDDGEEMVNCDECGVWVHTRCSRFVKGETSFACDKCKRRKKRTRNNHNSNHNDDNEEETEVAQLLVELPAKTIAATMNSNKSSYMTSSSPAPARSSSLMLWTHIPPVEERVHVQGVPGGDPKLFQGVSAVFTPELWKCSGYVPKKFSFQYREFPCWDDEDNENENHENREEKKVEEGSENPGDNPVDNPVDRGADALFSLSKEVVSASPVEMLVGLRGSGESGSREKNVAQKEGRSRGSEDSSGRYVQNGAGKEGNQGRGSGVHLGKRKDGLRSKDLGGKKKARTASKEVEGKRRVPSSAISGDKTGSVELGATKIAAADFQDSKNKDKLATFDHKADNGSNANTSKLKDHLAFSAHYARDSSRKEKFKDGLAAAVNVHHNKDLSKKVNSRDNLEANGEDSYNKVKPKVSLEAKSHNVDDSFKKGKSKDKLFAKPHHVEDFSKKIKSKDNQASNVYRGEDTSKETWGNSSLVEIVVKSENVHEDRSRNGSSSEAVTVEVSLLEPTGVNAVTKNEDLNSVGRLDHLNDGKRDPHGLRVNLSNFALPSTKLKPPVTEVPKNRVQDSIESKALDSLQPDINVKAEANEIAGKVTSSVVSSLMVDVKLDETESLDQHPSISVSEHPCESFPGYEADKSNIPSDEKAITESSALSCCIEDNTVKGMLPVSGEPCQNKEVIGSAGTLSVQECSSEPKHLKCGEELSKTGGNTPSIPTSLPQRNKIVLGCGKSSSTVLISKSEVSGGCKPPGRPASPSTLRPIHFTKRVKTTSNADITKDQIKLNSNGDTRKDDTRKDDTVVDTIKEDHRQDEPRKTVVEQLKASAVSVSKSSHVGRVGHASISKRSLTDSKEVVHYSYSKAPTAHNVTVCSGSIESINAMQSQSVSQVQSKSITSDFSEKGEKSSQSGCHSSSKVTSSSMHPPAPVNSSSTLSDEELALLLHQELNSSPRVPRVPRARQAPLAASTTTNMLIKRASGAGIKDHIWASRRKNKEEVQKEASNSSGELSDERKKTGRVLSNDHERQDEVLTSDSSTKKEAPASPEAENSTVKHMPLASTSTFGQSSSTEVIDQNLSSPHNSSRNTSDDADGNDDDVDDEDADANEDDADGVAGPATRTLPGLLDEIMSKGKRMTYEELCNAVLPHWNNLRKHNGERYAYSSHSQAVLDCLRNRSEWARLVDRGPKTNGGRKKGRPESEPPVVEPEEHVYTKSRMNEELVGKKFDVHTEDFPKGKRMARKRRRLALQGKGIRDIRKRQKTNAVVTDEDLGPLSHSSDTGDVFSEDGQGARARPNGSEVSASSDDADQ